MIFAHDTEVSLAATAALVNTSPDGRPGVEALPDVAALGAFLDEWGWTGLIRRDEAELQQVRDLRPRLRELWETDRDGVVELVNAMLRDARALPQLVRHDGWDFHLHAVPDDVPLVTRITVETAMAVVDLVRTDQLDRLGTCAMDDCDDVLVDLSKNRSKRYCDNGCGNRAAVAAYRARKAAGG